MEHDSTARTGALRSTLAALALGAALAPAAAPAAGFGLYEGSARGNVTPAGLAANGGDASALYFNPAAITAVPGTQAALGLTAIVPTADVTTRNPYTGERNRSYGDGKVWPIPHAYLTSQLSDSLWCGLGVGTRFGLGAEFDEDWPGRYSSYKAEILSFDVAPTLAWKATDRLSLAVGISIRYFDIELAQKIDAAGMNGLRNYNDPSASPFDVDQNLHGDDVKPALDLGLAYKATDTLTVGAAYHSRIKFKCEGDAKWRKPPAVQALAPAAFSDTTFHAYNYNPDAFLLSLAWDATERLTLSAGATYTTWSLYDDLQIDLHAPMLPGVAKLQSDKKWHDTWRLSLGGDYTLDEAWTLRAGYTWDQSPINGRHVDYLVPGDNRHILAVGAGWSRDAWTVEASYFYEIVDDFDVKGRPRNGVYDGKFCGASAHALALTVARSF